LRGEKEKEKQKETKRKKFDATGNRTVVIRDDFCLQLFALTTELLI